MPVLSQIVDEAHYVDTHVVFRDDLQSRETSEQEVLRRLAMAGKTFEVGCCQLNESSKKVPLLSPVSRCVPQPLEHFMAFPPVGVVIKIDSIQVLVRPSPLLGKEQDRLRDCQPIRMSLRVATRMR